MKAPPPSPGLDPADAATDSGTPARSADRASDRGSLSVVPGPALDGPSWGRRGAPPDAFPRVPPSPPRPAADEDSGGNNDGGRGGHGGGYRGNGGLGPGLEMTLVTAARTGDLEAYECLVRTHRDDLVRLGVWLLADGGEAQDAVRDTLVLAWRRLPTLREPRLFRAWLYQIMTRRCLEMLRQASHPRSLGWDGAAEPRRAEVPSPVNRPGGPGEQAPLTAIDTALSRALHQLPPEQRTVWALRELHQQSYAEIAQSTGSSVSTVRGRLARARRHLPAALSAWR